MQILKTQVAAITTEIGLERDASQKDFPVALPLMNEDQFEELEAALKDTLVRQKMVTRLALVGGTNADSMIRRMLTATLANSLASTCNWKGKGQKRAFKDTLLQDCMFGEFGT
ncbi:hypothetical protein ATANTOWER_028231 [Ataeniobius toweri]|uniref:DUF4806 domain-containing protein n=1 Tax=Ataeniobius toweri TaxID=208326 RepID=A0ABU7BVH7_9TELE|nr:hypothetical protein [Ataeniobius toweri]